MPVFKAVVKKSVVSTRPATNDRAERTKVTITLEQEYLESPSKLVGQLAELQGQTVQVELNKLQLEFGTDKPEEERKLTLVSE